MRYAHDTLTHDMRYAITEKDKVATNEMKVNAFNAMIKFINQ